MTTLSHFARILCAFTLGAGLSACTVVTDAGPSGVDGGVAAAPSASKPAAAATGTSRTVSRDFDFSL